MPSLGQQDLGREQREAAGLGPPGVQVKEVPEFGDIKTWTERLGRSRLRTFTDAQGHFWIEQNPAKVSKWAKLAREGHEMAWEFDSPGGAYTGRLLIDGEVYTSGEAAKKFF